MNINYENIKAAYYRGQNILKIYSGSTMEWEYETEPMEQTTKQIWYNSVSGDVVEPYAASAIGTVVSNTAYETKCVLEFASDVTAIGANAFSGCTDLEYVSIPVNATSIGDNAFDGCSSLDDIYMPSVQSIGRESFKDCVFTAFTMPTSVTAITADAFKGVAIEEFNYVGTKAQWSGITYGDFWDEDMWITNVVHCSDGDIELYPHNYSKDYLTLVARDSGTLQFNGSTTANTISYSTDGGNTWSTPATSVTINVNSGDSVMWKGEMTPSNNGIGSFSNKWGGATFDAQGNVMSLLYGDNYKNQTSFNNQTNANWRLFYESKVVNAENLVLPATALTDNCYYQMFRYCGSLTTAPQLQATTLANYCYGSMFADCTSLTTAPDLSATTLTDSCYNGMFADCTSLTKAPQLPATTLADRCYNSMFDGCTSLVTAPELPATTLRGNSNQYAGMFRGCTSLTTAPQLPATTMIQYCYSGMFEGCTSLTTPPSLPATTLAGNCYSSMFVGCTSLTTAPQLNATSLANYCYNNMFKGCTSLTTAPSLPSTSLGTACYANMFEGCTSLTTAPELPASRVRGNAYNSMFKGCTSLTTPPVISATTIEGNYYGSCLSMFEGCTALTTAPQLNATSIGENSYKNMFKGCTSLTQAPQLPATTLADNCYRDMFYGCTSLTQAPQLPATTLASGCYDSMFESCSNLTTPPSLPATTLANACYQSMFYSCSKLETAPELLAPTLVDSCYHDMFNSCSKLNYIKMLATDISASNCLNNWVTGVANSGTFVKAASMTSLPTGASGIPNGWTVQDDGASPTHDYSQDYFTLVAKEDGTFNFSGSSTANTISYSTDSGDTWSTPSSSVTINVNSGDTVLWKGNMTPTSNGIGTFSDSTATFDAQGNTMSLLYGDNYKNQTSLSGKNYAFKYLFKGSKVVNSENMILPATTLSNRCYTWMFSGCTSLVTAPELPATTMAECSYGNMFEGCSSLTTAPQLPATNLSSEAYSSMFQNCTSLTTAPSLPATTLSRHCYKYMFKGCSSLTTAPELLAASLDYESYWDMFRGCTNLNYIKMLATDISAYGCLSNWVQGVAQSGTFVKDANTTLPTGDSGIPNGWTVQDDGVSPEHDYSQDYLTLVARDNGTFQFSGTTTANTISYSTDNGNTWSTPAQEVTVNVNSGDNVLWKGEMTPTSNGIGTFSGGTATFDAQGNTMSLLYGDNYKNQTSLSGKDYAFSYLFRGTKVVNAENMIMPATTLADYCYQRMFQDCKSLTTAPKLPATTLNVWCYNNMFNGCTALTTAPSLPAKTVVERCYGGMFAYCSSIVNAPELPATTLAVYCYESMFFDCTNLKYIKMLATDISASNCLMNWVLYLGNSGTFVKNASMTTLPTGQNGIPNGWTVEDAQAFPVSDFNFNYNFKNYDSATHTVPNDPSANWKQDLVLQGTPVVDTDHITVTDSDAYAQFPFNTASENIFNRNDTNGYELTIIFKVSGCTGDNLISNRGFTKSTGGSDAYNWMVRTKSNNTMCLHDSSSEKGSLRVTTNPNIVVMTVDSNRFLTTKSITDNITATSSSLNFSLQSGRINFLCSNNSSYPTTTVQEMFSGICYWMFHANRVLTDAEITQVIDYNENL